MKSNPTLPGFVFWNNTFVLTLINLVCRRQAGTPNDAGGGQLSQLEHWEEVWPMSNASHRAAGDFYCIQHTHNFLTIRESSSC